MHKVSKVSILSTKTDCDRIKNHPNGDTAKSRPTKRPTQVANRITKHF